MNGIFICSEGYFWWSLCHQTPEVLKGFRYEDRCGFGIPILVRGHARWRDLKEANPSRFEAVETEQDEFSTPWVMGIAGDEIAGDPSRWG